MSNLSKSSAIPTQEVDETAMASERSRSRRRKRRRMKRRAKVVEGVEEGNGREAEEGNGREAEEVEEGREAEVEEEAEAERDGEGEAEEGEGEGDTGAEEGEGETGAEEGKGETGAEEGKEGETRAEEGEGETGTDEEGETGTEEGVEEEGEEDVDERKGKEVEIIKAVVPSTGKEKAFLFSTIFTRDDEIHILKSILLYKLDNDGKLPNKKALSESVRQFPLSHDFTPTQLYEKVRRMKEKFINYKMKRGGSGSKQMDEEFIRMSEQLWGGEELDTGGGGEVRIGKGKVKNGIKKNKIEILLRQVPQSDTYDCIVEGMKTMRNRLEKRMKELKNVDFSGSQSRSRSRRAER